MSIIYQIPHSSRYIETASIFNAQFNNPVLGKYSFSVPGNVGVKILDLILNTVYLIERITIGGDISEENYLEALNILPLITLKRKVSNEIVYKFPYPVTQFTDDKPIVAWLVSEKGGDQLTADFTGLLDQIPALVGKLNIKINISYSIYAIESTVFYNKFRNILSGQVGDQVTGAMQTVR